MAVTGALWGSGEWGSLYTRMVHTGLLGTQSPRASVFPSLSPSLHNNPHKSTRSFCGGYIFKSALLDVTPSSSNFYAPKLSL